MWRSLKAVASACATSSKVATRNECASTPNLSREQALAARSRPTSRVETSCRFRSAWELLLDRVLQDSFLDLVAVHVLNPRLIADSSQVVDKPECVFGSSECIFADPLGPFAFTIIPTCRPLPPSSRRGNLTPLCFKQKRLNGSASHKTSMTGGLASPNRNDYRWPDSDASNRRPPGIGFFVAAIAQG